MRVRNGLKLGTTASVLAATYTIAADSPPVHALDPDGSTRKVLMPLASANTEGLAFFIINWAGGAEDLTVKDSTDTTTYGTISQNESAWMVCARGVWYMCLGTIT
jgi:hypothetical protein